LRPAVPVEGATLAPYNMFSDKWSERGWLRPAVPVEGATLAPYNMFSPSLGWELTGRSKRLPNNC
ncbi:hypothetical protein EB093_03715, partial [bacterium]|nr:hypothetical protein [bacterium]